MDKTKTRKIFEQPVPYESSMSSTIDKTVSCIKSCQTPEQLIQAVKLAKHVRKLEPDNDTKRILFLELIKKNQELKDQQTCNPFAISISI